MSPKKEPYNREAIKKACEFLGSGRKLSIAINADCKSIYLWRNGKATPSPLNCIRIEKATFGFVKKEEIRPDFDWGNFKLF